MLAGLPPSRASRKQPVVLLGRLMHLGRECAGIGDQHVGRRGSTSRMWFIRSSDQQHVLALARRLTADMAGIARFAARSAVPVSVASFRMAGDFLDRCRASAGGEEP